MLPLLILFMMNDTIPQAARDTLAADSLRTDTLMEVVVVGGEPQVSKAIGRSIEAWKKSQPKTKSLGDVLEKWSPGLNDKITHPFAIKQRKMERKRKRTKKILEHYDRVKTFDELLRESIREQEERERKNGEAPENGK